MAAWAWGTWTTRGLGFLGAAWTFLDLAVAGGPLLGAGVIGVEGAVPEGADAEGGPVVVDVPLSGWTEWVVVVLGATPRRPGTLAATGGTTPAGRVLAGAVLTT